MKTAYSTPPIFWRIETCGLKLLYEISVRILKVVHQFAQQSQRWGVTPLRPKLLKRDGSLVQFNDRREEIESTATFITLIVRFWRLLREFRQRVA